MATYPEITAWVRSNYGFDPQTCWIADIKAGHGLTRGIAHNRLDPVRKVKPCPADKRAAIEGALIHFGMI